MDPTHDSYWDIRQDKSVHITSPIGQAQFMLSYYLRTANIPSKDWMLLCRFADTISIEDGQPELRKLRRLAEYLKKNSFQPGYSNVNPAVAIEIEKEIILRTAPYYAEGMGHDITPATRMLEHYERKAPVFTQAERNLILRYAYFVGDTPGTEQLAAKIAAHNISNRDIAAVCASIETADLEWSGLEKMEGITVGAAEGPTSQFSFKNCENPMKKYPRFTFYPEPVSFDAVLLQSGVILRSCPDDMDRWQSRLLRIDQTYTAPRYYIQTGHDCFEMAERVDEAHDLEALLSNDNTLSPPTPSKPSVLRQLQETMEEIRRCEGKAKDGGAQRAVPPQQIL